MSNYATLFEGFEYYLLPDGTDVQAIWVDDAGPPYWVLVPGDNPRSPEAEHKQYRVHPDGSISAEYWAAQPSGPILTIPQAHQLGAGVTDLTLDDLRPEARQ